MALLFQYLSNAAELYPEKVAIRYKDQSVTYRELDIASSRLASSMLRSGVLNGDRVGIYLTKSIEAVISIYAILKAGAVYVPIDPVAPIKRVELILSDCGASSLVTSAERMKYLNSDFLCRLGAKALILTNEASIGASTCGIPVLSWDEALCEDRAVANDTPSQDAGRAAYILYTSGSTGSPKGVTLSHSNGAVFVEWAQQCFGVWESDHIASHAPFHFDLSIFDIFVSAKVGATLLLVPENRAGLGTALVKFIVDNSVTVWFSVPSALMRMIDAENHFLLSSSALRLILFAGEVFPPKHLRKLCSISPQAELYNLYGPTETNACTYYRVSKKAVIRGQSDPLPIGRACDYATVFTIDDRGEIIDLHGNEEGELCVGGPSVMLGYWNDPVKTSSSYVACPKSLVNNGQAYRTGDIVRKDQEGNYLFVGRRDHMIKSRGYRIELGEVESALLSHPKVDGAVVVAVQDPNMGVWLQAYLVLQQGAGLDEHELRQHCVQVLPRYMIPQGFQFLDEFPITSTGKVDRHILEQWSKQQLYQSYAKSA